MSGPTDTHHLFAPLRLRPVMAVTVLAVLALSILRISNAVSFSIPIQVMTSGDEVASVFAIWKVLQGQDVYTSRFEPPFALAVYNWLFYLSTAAWSGVWQNLTGLGDAWLPVLGRFWTLGGTMAGAAAAFVLFRSMLRRDGEPGNFVPACLAMLLAFGPLYGFWVVTVRPDVWAVSLEIIAVCVFHRLLPSGPTRAAAAMASVAYLAWSFKHTAVFGLGGVGLFLLLRRDFKALAVLTAISTGLWAATFLIQDDIYFETLFTIGHPLEYDTSRFLDNLVNVAFKTPYLWIPVAAAFGISILRGRFRHLLQAESAQLAACGLFVSLAATLVMTLQTGSAEHYYFTPAFFLSMLFVALFPRISATACAASRVFRLATVSGFALTSLAVVAVLAGQAGMVAPQGDQKLIDRRLSCIEVLPSPMYVHDRMLSLPWNSPGNTPFVRNFYYERDREAGREYPVGGIGGMIEAGMFEAIAYPAPNPPAKIDGAGLRTYTKLPVICGEMTIFLKSGRDDMDLVAEALRATE